MSFEISVDMFLELLWLAYSEGFEDGKDGYDRKEYRDFIEKRANEIAFMESKEVPSGGKH